MYLCFTLRDIDGIPAPSPFELRESEDPIEGMYCLLIGQDRWQKYEILTENQHRKTLRLFAGYLNLPLYRFDQAKWDAGEDPFIPHDFADSAQIKAWFRRRLLKSELELTIPHETELKKMRKAIKAIVAKIPELLLDPDIDEFMSLSDHIETVIETTRPKAETGKIDLRAENG